MKVTITIRQEDIDFGCKGSRTRCMAALAVGRHLHKDAFVAIGGAENKIMDADSAFHFHLPHSTVVRHIADFDHGLPVEPFEFEVDIPAKYLKDPERK